MFIKFHKIQRISQNLGDTRQLYTIEEVVLNSEKVQKIEPNLSMQEDLKKGYFPEGLPKQTQFSSIYSDGEVITVIGSMSDTMEKLNFRGTLLCD